MSYQSFKKKWMGKRVDYDKVYAYQCVDLIKQYAAEHFKSKPGAWGNAIDYARKPASSFTKTFVKTNNPVQGDIVVFAGGTYGHIGLVDGISSTAINTLEQNGSTGNGSGVGGDAIRLRWIPKSRVAAYFTPRDKSVNAPKLKSFQRLVGAAGNNYREKPSTSGKLKKAFKPGEILDFAGFVKGQSVKGNNIWFKGRYSHGYSWSGSFTNKSTSGLKDLTPKPDAPEPVVPDPIKVPAPTPPAPKPPVQTPEPALPMPEPEPEPIAPELPVEPEKPAPVKEMSLEGLRIAVLGVISLALTSLAEWLSMSVMGWTFLPENLTLEIAGVLTLALRLADKYAYVYLKKIGTFAETKWAKIVKRFKLPF